MGWRALQLMREVVRPLAVTGKDEAAIARPFRRRTASLVITISLFSLLASCESWRGHAGVLERSLEPRAQIRLWARGAVHQVHGVRVVGDSVTAVPFIRPPDCDSCALHVALRDIDSVQVRTFDRDKSIFMALVVAPIIYFVMLSFTIPRD